MMQRLNHWLIYAILFLLPWQTHLILKSFTLNGQPWQYGVISLFVIDILIILAVIGHVWSHTSLDLSLKKIPYRYLLVSLLLFLLAILPFSLSPQISLAKTVYLIVAILFVYVLEREPVPFRSSALAFVLGAVSSALLGLWQFISQSSFASSKLGLALHDPAVLGTTVVEAVAPDGVLERWLRAYGSLDHPNMFGGFMALSLIFAAWLWLTRENDRSSWRNATAIISTVILSAAVLVSFSRAAWLAAATGLLIIIATKIKAQPKKIKEPAILLGSIILVVALLLSQYGYLFTSRFNTDARLENISVTERSAGLKDSLHLTMARPFFGSGAGTYSLALEKYLPKKQSWFYQPVHNVFILVSAEIGLIGLALFLVSLAAFIVYIYRKRKTNSGAFIFAVVSAVFIIALLDHWLYSLHFGIICSGVLIGLLANASGAETLTE